MVMEHTLKTFTLVNSSKKRQTLKGASQSRLRLQRSFGHRTWPRFLSALLLSPKTTIAGYPLSAALKVSVFSIGSFSVDVINQLQGGHRTRESLI